tara:strand:- start:1842 stop:3626 length:1785 start_codon:yes stop_codon:yes gene_type:complete
MISNLVPDAFGPYIAVLALVLCFAGLAKKSNAADAVVIGCLGILIVSGSVSLEGGLAGFSNPGVIAIGTLFVVAAGLRDSGAMHLLGTRLLSTPKNERNAQWLVTGPVGLMSSFVNNTPLVALYLPMVKDWAGRHGISPSRLLIPMSYAAIAGGTVTMLGSSTNLVANSALRAHVENDPGLGFLEQAWIGVPLLISVLLYVQFVGRRLAIRKAPTERLSDARRYSLEMMIDIGGALEGRSVAQAGLRQLAGLYLSEVIREEEIIAPVEPTTVLYGGDRLVFFGDPGNVSDLLRIAGISPPSDKLFSLSAQSRSRHLTEAVISTRSPLVGNTVRDSAFRESYDAAIIAVSRDGSELEGRIGDIVFEPGDTLILDGTPGFAARWTNSRDFLLVRSLDGDQVPVRRRPWLALGAVAAMVLGNAFGLWTVLQGALLAAATMVLARCTTLNKARQSVDWSMLIVIAGAIGIGNSLAENGLLQPIADAAIVAAGDKPRLLILAIFAVAALVTTLVSNAAAVALTMPLALAAGSGAGLSAHAITITVIVGCSASFATPMAYQTNLMVMGPGGYTLGDFMRFGTPLVLIFGFLAVLLIPIIY